MIGAKLYELRTLYHMSQQELARTLEVSVKSIKNWENDISDPCLTSLKALATVFSVSADELMGITMSNSISLSRLSIQDQNKIRRAVLAYIAEASKESM